MTFHGQRMVVYTYLCAGASVVFAESPETLARDMVKVRPTLTTAVPRVFEKESIVGIAT
jgi:long-subunit acyl-CoA synthetase (AMP-forming)